MDQSVKSLFMIDNFMNSYDEVFGGVTMSESGKICRSVDGDARSVSDSNSTQSVKARKIYVQSLVLSIQNMGRPNVLWICTDQQRFDTLGCYANEFVETAHIDGMASEGVRFDRCYSQCPVCTPSRASFLTGRYPRTTRCRQNGQRIPEDELLITRSLADSGYTCGLAGKLHIAPCNPNKPEEPMTERRIDDGYAEFHWSHHPGPDWPTNEYIHWLRERNIEFEDDLVDDEGSGARRIDRSHEFDDVADCEYVQISLPPEYHQTTWCADKAINFIEANAEEDQPWLFSVNTFDSHHAFDPPMEYLERYLDRLDEIPLPNYEDGEIKNKSVFQHQDHNGGYNTPGYFAYSEMSERDHRLVRAAYWAMCDLIDDQVGRMLEALERTGQREDTLVIFMSDHGELLGDHGIYLKGPYFYESAIRVPLVVSQPGTIPEGVESDALVELVDLAPTLLDAVEEEPLPRMQGQSLWPLLIGDTDVDAHRDVVYSEYYNAMPWHDDPELPFGTMVRTDRYKLVKMHRLASSELYDLETDPNETQNRWDDPAYASIKMNLLDTLADQMAETVDPVPERQAPW